MVQVGKLLLATGLALVIVGAVLILSPRIPLLSKLDISLREDSWHVFFPLGTCLAVSGLRTLVLWLLRRW